MVDVRVGAMGWSYPDWVGPFYPSGVRSPRFLAEYARRFDCVELDSTFYGIPRPTAVRGWADATPPHFRFAAKVPREITHERHLRDGGPTLYRFVETMDALGEKLGPLLVQLPPDFHATDDNRDALRTFCALLPDGYRFAVEFRHRSWLTDATLDTLRQYGAAWTVIDLSWMPRRVALTSDIAYVRLLGDRRQVQRVDRVQIDRDADLASWAGVVRELSAEVRQAWIFINNHYGGHSPANIRTLRALLGGALAVEDAGGEGAEEGGRFTGSDGTQGALPL